jgi:AcrR family transcriptional regulator
MNNENEIKAKILTKAAEMFNQYGYSKITMEEIAVNLGISKKTLYKYFSNKEHVLKELVENIRFEVSSFIDSVISDSSMEFIDKLNTLMNYFAKFSKIFSEPLSQDIMKNHPEVWKGIQETRKHKAYSSFTMLIEEGIKSGVFRDDIDKDLVVIAYVSAIHGMINPEVTVQLPLSAQQIHKSLSKIFFEGILSEEGRKKYQTSKLVNVNNGEIEL